MSKTEFASTGYVGTLGEIQRRVEHHLRLFFKKGVKQTTVPYVKGPPGVGKSEMFRFLASLFEANYYDVPLIVYDQADLRGLPHIMDGVTRWAQPGDLPRPGGPPCVLHLDEFTQTYPAIQACASRLILDRRLGEYVVPDNVFICLASNREQDRASTHKMGSFLNNRLAHYEVRVDINEWRQWAIQHDIEPIIIALISFAPDLLHDFDPDRPAFPSPRSWSFLSTLMMDAKPEDWAGYASATVGDNASHQLELFRKNTAGLPTFDDVLAAPDKASVPDEPSAMFAAAVMVAMRISSTTSKAWNYIERLPSEHQHLAFRILMSRPNFAEMTGQGVIRSWVERNPHHWM